MNHPDPEVQRTQAEFKRRGDILQILGDGLTRQGIRVTEAAFSNTNRHDVLEIRKAIAVTREILKDLEEEIGIPSSGCSPAGAEDDEYFIPN